MNRSNAAVETGMKYAPIKVARTGNSVIITAFIKFTGDADSCFPDAVKSGNSECVPGHFAPYCYQVEDE
jgi:hypothetical protein